MKNIVYDGYLGPRLNKAEQMKRMRLVIDNELTPRQRQCLLGYYMERKSIPALARETGLNKSTISRTLKRAERRMQAYLRY